MESRGLVLVVEDEAAIADVERMYLERAGYAVEVVGDGLVALDVIRSRRPVAILLDVGLPGLDGVEVCRRLRAGGDWTPLLFVTARDDEVDRVVSPRELVARVAGLLRRESRSSGGDVLAAGEVRLEPEARRVYVGDAEVHLTATEFDLLAYLMARTGRVVSREQLLTEVWGHASVAGTRTVDVHVAQLRGKLGPDSPVRTVRGVGYAAERGPAT
jgi:DNA-binding response OmpR family regulator